jgi:hypothetical protein
MRKDVCARVMSSTGTCEILLRLSIGPGTTDGPFIRYGALTCFGDSLNLFPIRSPSASFPVRNITLRRNWIVRVEATTHSLNWRIPEAERVIV